MSDYDKELRRSSLESQIRSVKSSISNAEWDIVRAKSSEDSSALRSAESTLSSLQSQLSSLELSLRLL